jgi:hypothetical protein
MRVSGSTLCASVRSRRGSRPPLALVPSASGLASAIRTVSDQKPHLIFFFFFLTCFSCSYFELQQMKPHFVLA